MSRPSVHTHNAFPVITYHLWHWSRINRISFWMDDLYLFYGVATLLKWRFWMCLWALTCLYCFSEKGCFLSLHRTDQSIACVDRRRNKARHGCDCLADCNSRHTLFHMHVQKKTHTNTHTLTHRLKDFYSYLPTRFNYISHSSGRVNSAACGCGFCYFQKHPDLWREHL